MSRSIDPNALTPLDVEYIRVRPNLRREFLLQGLGDPLEPDYPGLVDEDGNPLEPSEAPSPASEEPDGTEPGDGDEKESDGDTEEVPGEDYDSWKNKELKAELEKRGLPVSGNHDELVARLQESDSSE
jgi:hypothetical protein